MEPSGNHKARLVGYKLPILIFIDVRIYLSALSAQLWSLG